LGLKPSLPGDEGGIASAHRPRCLTGQACSLAVADQERNFAPLHEIGCGPDFHQWDESEQQELAQRIASIGIFMVLHLAGTWFFQENEHGPSAQAGERPVPSGHHPFSGETHTI